jgi:hypothetical protein
MLKQQYLSEQAKKKPSAHALAEAVAAIKKTGRYIGIIIKQEVQVTFNYADYLELHTWFEAQGLGHLL